MSLYLDFEPHSWYMGFAIKRSSNANDDCQFTYTTDSKVCTVHGRRISPMDNYCDDYESKWSAYTDDGNTYRVVVLNANTKAEIKERVRGYHIKKRDGYGERLLKRTSKPWYDI